MTVHVAPGAVVSRRQFCIWGDVEMQLLHVGDRALGRVSGREFVLPITEDEEMVWRVLRTRPEQIVQAALIPDEGQHRAAVLAAFARRGRRRRR